jgi:hypothetical protein
MNTNGRLKVANHKSCNGKPFAGRDSANSSVQSRGVSRKTLWGLSMVVVALFRFCMTWALNVPPEPVNVALTSITGVLGVTLFTWGRLKDRSAMQTLVNSRHR